MKRLLLFSPLLLAACAGTGPLPATYFNTYIAPDNSKRFVIAQANSGPAPSMRADNEQRQRRQDDEGDKPLTQALDALLKKNGYCRTGYMIISRDWVEGKPQLSGECNESATAADRQHFRSDPSLANDE